MTTSTGISPERNGVDEANHTQIAHPSRSALLSGSTRRDTLGWTSPCSLNCKAGSTVWPWWLTVNRWLFLRIRLTQVRVAFVDLSSLSSLSVA